MPSNEVCPVYLILQKKSRKCNDKGILFLEVILGDYLRDLILREFMQISI